MKRILTVVCLILFLLAIRYFQDDLFDDPLINFFKSDFSDKPLPVINNTSFYASMFLRYFLNTLASLAIIFVIFREKSYLIFSTIIYALAFLLLTLAFWYVYHYQSSNYLALFYIRRFLIQPLFLLILIPGLLYLKYASKAS